MSKNVLLIYLFDSGVYSDVDTIDKAIKAAKPLALNAKKFATSLNIGYRDDHWGVVDDSFSFRLSFYIEGSQDAVLPKVSLCSLLLHLINWLLLISTFSPNNAIKSGL